MNFISLIKVPRLQKATFQKEKGFSLVEIIISSTIISIVGVALVISTRAFFEMSEKNSINIRSSIMLNELANSLKFLRDDSWEQNIAPLNFNQNYYITQTETGPIISGVTPVNSSNLANQNHIAFFAFSEIFRDEKGEIVQTGGELDENSRLVNLIVEWNTKGSIETIEAEMLLHNLFKNHGEE